MPRRVASHLLCANDVPRVHLVALLLEDLGHAEVGDLGAHLVVEEHVAGLEVPVHDLEQRVLVEVEQAAGDADDDVVPGAPPQLRALARVCRAEQRSTSTRQKLDSY